MKTITGYALLALLAGCATHSEPMPAHIVEQLNKPTICSGDAECNLYWQRAAFYVNSNSAFKVQTMTPDIIQTYSPTGGDSRLGYNVSREPIGAGKYRVWVKLWCDNMFGCNPGVANEMLRIKSYISTGNMNSQ